MPIYLIERINRDTGATKVELAEAPLLAIAFIEQETKHGKDYKYRLVGRLENGNIVGYEPDHNKVNKDKLDRFQQYQKSIAESLQPPISSLTLHNRAYLRYMIKGKGKGSDQNTKTKKRL